MAKSTRHTAPTAPGGVEQAELYLTGTDATIGGDLTVRGDLRIVGAADEDLHGGGQEVFYAAVSANFTTASTTFVTITGGTAAFTVPSRPFRIFASVPVNIEEIGQGAEMRILANGTTQVDWDFTPRASVAGQPLKQWLSARVPGPTWSPTAGAAATVALQLRTLAASSDVSVIVDFAGPFQLCEIQGVTC